MQLHGAATRCQSSAGIIKLDVSGSALEQITIICHKPFSGTYDSRSNAALLHVTGAQYKSINAAFPFGKTHDVDLYCDDDPDKDGVYAVAGFYYSSTCIGVCVARSAPNSLLSTKSCDQGVTWAFFSHYIRAVRDAFTGSSSRLS